MTTTTVVLPLEKADYSTAAQIQHDAFASDPISALIWGETDPVQGLQNQIQRLNKIGSEPWRTLRKAVRRKTDTAEEDNDEEIVAISISGLIVAKDETQKMKDDEPPVPGTNVDLLNEFYGMLGGLMEQFKKRDPKFYRECRNSIRSRGEVSSRTNVAELWVDPSTFASSSSSRLDSTCCISKGTKDRSW